MARSFICVCVFLMSMATAWPQGRQPLPGGSSGTVVVQVRSLNGTPLAGFALVRLFNPVGSFDMKQTTREGGRATFAGVPIGEYQIEVTSAGFERAQEEVSVFIPDRQTFALVALRPEGTTTLGRPASGSAILTPKAQKELDRAQVLLKADKAKEALEHLLRAYKLAPGHPDICYLLGSAYLRLQQYPDARTYFEKALSLDPKHLPALNSMAAVHAVQSENAQALQLLTRAIELAPTSWKSHWMIATILIRMQDFPKSLESIDKAIAMSAEAEPSLYVLRAQILQALGRLPEAIEQLETYMAKYAERPDAAALRQRLKALKASENALSAGAAADSVAAEPLPTAAYTAAVGTWAPPDVDEVTPATESGVTCALPEVLKATGQRAVAMVETLQRFTATETIHRRMFDARFDTETQWTFEYLAMIEQPRPGLLAVTDYRKAKGPSPHYDRESKVTAMALVFHPFYVDDFDMRCEGRGEVAGQAAWIVYFRQRADKTPRFRMYRAGGQSYRVKLKGRAWISVNSSQVIRLQTDTLEPIPELRLTRDHLVIDYAPVQFEKLNQRVWLPATAEFYSDPDGKRYRDRFTYSNFMLFSVDAKQKIEDPVVPTDPPR